MLMLKILLPSLVAMVLGKPLFLILLPVYIRQKEAARPL
jgi:hypothetical protein